MGVKGFFIDTKELSTHQYLRFDEKFWHTTKKMIEYDHILLKNIFNLINGNSHTEHYTQEITSIPYIRIGDLTFKHYIDGNDLVYLDDDCEINEKQRLEKDDLLLAAIGATIGKINLAREFEGGTFSNNIVLLRLKNKENENPYFYEKLFQSSLLQKYIWGVVSQKAQPNLQMYDLENIKIPIVQKVVQDAVVAQIAPIEQKIKQLKAQLIPTQEIINKVFAREFGFDLGRVNKVEQQKYNFISSDITYKNFNLRTSVRWNKIKPIQEILYKDNPYIDRLGKYITSIKNGWSPTCMETDTEYLVFGVNCISKDTVMNYDDLKMSNEKRNNIADFFVKNGDLFISRGNTIDLVALASIVKNLPSEKDIIFSDLFIRIEVKEKWLLKEYLAYLVNSIIGRFYFKYAAKGKNQTMVKVSSEELNNFYLPIPPLEMQQKIVNEIKAELDKQQEIKIKITQERAKIDQLIEEAVNFNAD